MNKTQGNMMKTKKAILLIKNLTENKGFNCEEIKTSGYFIFNLCNDDHGWIEFVTTHSGEFVSVLSSLSPHENFKSLDMFQRRVLKEFLV